MLIVIIFITSMWSALGVLSFVFTDLPRSIKNKKLSLFIHGPIIWVTTLITKIIIMYLNKFGKVKQRGGLSGL